jgi:hypothetical protein
MRKIILPVVKIIFLLQLYIYIVADFSDKLHQVIFLSLELAYFRNYGTVQYKPTATIHCSKCSFGYYM